MEHPELLQAYRSRKKRFEIGHLIASVIIAGLLICMAAFTARAETYQELQDRYGKVEVGIAPPEAVSNTPNTSNALETLGALELPAAEYLPFHENISQIFYKEWAAAGLELADMFVILDIESDGSGDGVILDKGHAISRTHDYGWFQINWPSWKGAAKRLYGVTSPEQLMDPYINVGMAIHVYGDCVARYGRGSQAWSCYNTGKGYNSTKYSRKAAAALAIWEERLKK